MRFGWIHKYRKKNLIFKVEIPEIFNIQGLKKGYENN